MPTKQVVITGTMTWAEEPGDTRPPGVPTHPIYYPDRIWGGGNVPMPNPPIANVPGGPSNPNPPGFGLRPEHPIFYPPGIWGPSDPRPSNPISGIPGLPGGPEWNPPNNPGLPPGGSPVPPAALVPIDGKLVFVPGYGWMFVPDSVLSGDRPHPEHPIELPPEEEGPEDERGGFLGLGKK